MVMRQRLMSDNSSIHDGVSMETSEQKPIEYTGT